MNKSLDSDIILQKKTFLWASVSDLNDREELSLIMKKYYTDKTKTIIEIITTSNVIWAKTNNKSSSPW